jgi:hypothetical protein
MKLLLAFLTLCSLSFAGDRYHPDQISFELVDGFLTDNYLVVKADGTEVVKQIVGISRKGTNLSYVSELKKLQSSQEDILKKANKDGVFVTISSMDRIETTRISLKPDLKVIKAKAQELQKKLSFAFENSTPMSKNILPEIDFVSQSSEVCVAQNRNGSSEVRASSAELEKIVEEIIRLSDKVEFVQTEN